jgi:hypothetical protein
MLVNKTIITMLVLCAGLTAAIAQQPVIPPAGSTTPAAPGTRAGAGAAKQEPKPYKEIITEKAISHTGLFTVHKVDDKWYFEIPDSILGRDILVSTRYGKTAAGGNYGGEQVNLQTINWRKGPSNTLFLDVLTIVNVATDSTQPIAQAVSNSNLNPIAAAFDIKAYGKASDSSHTTVIEVTDFFKGDNQAVSLTPNIKRRYNLNSISPERSYIESIRTYPINTEIRSIKTFTSTPTPPGVGNIIISGGTLPAANVTGAVTLEINNSFFFYYCQKHQCAKGFLIRVLDILQVSTLCMEITSNVWRLHVLFITGI